VKEKSERDRQMMGKSERQASDGEGRETDRGMMGKSERDRQMMGKSERQASDGEKRGRQRDRQVIENSERYRRASDGKEQQETGE
jgi:hypothetical protein